MEDVHDLAGQKPRLLKNAGKSCLQSVTPASGGLLSSSSAHGTWGVTNRKQGSLCIFQQPQPALHNADATNLFNRVLV